MLYFYVANEFLQGYLNYDFFKEITKLILSCKFNTLQERNPAVYEDFLTCTLDLPVSNMKKIGQSDNKLIGFDIDCFVTFYIRINIFYHILLQYH